MGKSVKGKIAEQHYSIFTDQITTAKTFAKKLCGQHPYFVLQKE
jgi:hypothetical protein